MTAVVVEDDLLVAGVFQAVLKRHDFIVLTAVTAQAGIRVCSDPGVTIDLVIVDRTLRSASGTGVALKMMALRPEIQILFTSGTLVEYWSAADLRNLAALPEESWGFLQKPFTAQKLWTDVKELMKRRPGLAMAGA